MPPAARKIVPPKSVSTVTDTRDIADINRLYGEITGSFNNLSSVNRSKAAAIAGKDFNNITAAATEKEFVSQAGNFLNNIIDDGKRISKLAGDHTTYEKEIAKKQGELEFIQQIGGYTDDAVKKALSSNGQGLLNSATEELANSTATLGKVGLDYGNRLEEKSGQLLQAWDQSKHNEKKGDIANAIGTVVSLLGNIGIGGNAIVQTGVKEAEVALKGAGEAWTTFGLRTGQVLNLFGAITSADVAVWRNSSPELLGAQIGQAEGKGMDNLKNLANRFTKYVDEFNHPVPPDPNPFLPVT